MARFANRPAFDAAVGLRLEQLAALVEAGTPTAAAAEALARAETQPRLKKALAQLAARLDQGEALGEALEPLGLTLAADDSGEQPEQTLRTLGEHARRRTALRASLRRALAYPLFLLLGLYALWLYVGAFLGPLMERYYVNLGAHGLPGLAQLLVQLKPTIVPLVIAAALVVFVPGLLRRIALSMPLLGGIVRRLIAAELIAATALRLRLGRPVDEAVGAAFDDVDWAKRPTPKTDGPKTAGPISRGLRAAGAGAERQIPSIVAALRRIASLLFALAAMSRRLWAPRAPAEGSSVEAALAPWLRGCDGLVLIAAERRGDDKTLLAAQAERTVDVLHAAALSRIAGLAPVAVITVGLAAFLLLYAVSTPLLAVAGNL